jgi:predicted lipid-binding transport protein (Tim44 family)
VEYLKAIGFVEESHDGISILRVENHDIAVMKASLQEVSNALDMVMAPINNTNTTTTKKSIKKLRMEQVEEEKKSDDAPLEKLSEKQKARRLLEEKERKEKEIARLHRKKTAAQIKQDKWVRANDPNWKSGVSAAMAKSGSGIETFRDRHGEH